MSVFPQIASSMQFQKKIFSPLVETDKQIQKLIWECKMPGAKITLKNNNAGRLTLFDSKFIIK